MKLDNILNNIFGYLVAIVILWLVLALSGCKTCQCLPETITRDSIRVEYQRDSIYAHDSIYIDRYKAGDTVYLTKERWSIRYRDVLHTDTMYVDHNTIEVRTERYIPGFYRWSTWVCWIIIVCFILYVAWRIFKAIYLHR